MEQTIVFMVLVIVVVVIVAVLVRVGGTIEMFVQVQMVRVAVVVDTHRAWFRRATARVPSPPWREYSPKRPSWAPGVRQRAGFLTT